MHIVQEPITGDEEVSDPGQPPQALAEFYRAFNSGDLALMAQNWDDSDEAVMDNPVGGIKRGWPEIRRVYERIFNSGAKVSVEFHDYTLHIHGDVFWAIGRERGRLEANGVMLDLAIRTSRVFRRVGGRWRQVHHHGSIDDPQLLASYQKAVR
ncbi:MAG TPA: nuclear transport factor 2 family protein [Gemmatimonadaceae bacterium]|nr:nuclear transport factor 2 family protein [Gemmatimonadaceae bacterium]